MEEKVLGKISKVSFGVEEGRFGLFLTLTGTWSVSTSYETWDPTQVVPDSNHKWKEADRDVELANISKKISKLLNDAKVSNINHLLNKPVEFTTKGNMLQSWRILTEVL